MSASSYDNIHDPKQSQRGSRRGAATSKARCARLFYLDGKTAPPVTAEQIAAKLGVQVDYIFKRAAKLRRRGETVTWDSFNP